MTETPVSDYEAVGGAPAVKVVVDIFYRRVLDDEQLARYFVGIDLPRLKRHQVLFVTKVLGGPDNYTGRPMDEAHAGLGVTGKHFWLVVAHLGDSLEEAGVPAEIVARAGAAAAALEPLIVTVEETSPNP